MRICSRVWFVVCLLGWLFVCLLACLNAWLFVGWYTGSWFIGLVGYLFGELFVYLVVCLCDCMVVCCHVGGLVNRFAGLLNCWCVGLLEYWFTCLICLFGLLFGCLVACLCV